jgi:hypothetical protein
VLLEDKIDDGNPRYDNETSPVMDFTTDTMHATLAGSLLDPFEDEEERTVFRAGGGLPLHVRGDRHRLL